MSRDNLMAVAKYNYYYVLAKLNIENQFNQSYIQKLLNTYLHKSTKNKGKALCIAHDIQKKLIANNRNRYINYTIINYGYAKYFEHLCSFAC